MVIYSLVLLILISKFYFSWANALKISHFFLQLFPMYLFAADYMSNFCIKTGKIQNGYQNFSKKSPWNINICVESPIYSVADIVSVVVCLGSCYFRLSFLSPHPLLSHFLVCRKLLGRLSERRPFTLLYYRPVEMVYCVFIGTSRRRC